MAGYQPSVIEPTVANPNDGGGVITPLVVSNPVNTPGPDATVTISGLVTGTPGTGATRASVYIYRGVSPNWTYVLQLDQAVTAGVDYTIPIVAVDTPGEVAGVVYSLAISMLNATANGTTEQALIHGIVS